jgi:uncharacterized protein with beta-barrel porin domain
MDRCGDDTRSRTLYAGYANHSPTADGKPRPPCSTRRTWRMWASPFGGVEFDGGNASVGSAATTIRGGGMNAGLDYQLDPDALIGFATGGDQSVFSVPDRPTSGTVNAYHIGAYGAYQSNNLYATGALSYGRFDNTENRTSTIPPVVLPGSQYIGGPNLAPGFNELLSGGYGAQSFGGRFESGYRNPFGALVVTPLAGMEFDALRTDAFTENNNKGPTVIGLSYSARNTLSLPGFLGLQLDSRLDLANDGSLEFHARAEWRHEFSPDRSTESAFVSAPVFNFVVQGAQPPRDAAVLSLGGKLAFSKNVALFGSVNGEIGGADRLFSGTGGIVVSWRGAHMPRLAKHGLHATRGKCSSSERPFSSSRFRAPRRIAFSQPALGASRAASLGASP